MTTINWGDVAQSVEQAQPPPPGTYTAHVMEASLKKASTGRDMITMRYRIIGGRVRGTAVLEQPRVVSRQPQCCRDLQTQPGMPWHPDSRCWRDHNGSTRSVPDRY